MKSPRFIVPTALTVLAASAGLAHAQCQAGWRQGPNESVAGLTDVITCSTLWDSDGNGPLPPRLVVGGTFFTSATGTVLNRIALWNGTQWVALGTGMNGRVDALTTQGNDLIAGGAFTTAGGTSAVGVARWNGTSWSALGQGLSGQPGTFGVKSLAVYNNELYAGGEFLTSGTTNTRRIARFDGANWAGLGSGITAGSGVPAVNALTVFNGQLYAGGNFAGAGGVTSPFIVRWNGSTWSTPAAQTVSDTIHALEVFNDELWVGGDFLQAGGINNIRRIARYNGTSFVAATTFYEPAQSIRSFEVFNGQLHMAGQGNPTAMITRWTGTTLEDSLINTSSGNILTLTNLNGVLVAAGVFSTFARVPVQQIGGWNGSSGVTFGPTLQSQPSDVPRDFVNFGGGVAAALEVTVGGVPCIATFDGTTWTADAGAVGVAKSITVDSLDRLVASGSFSGFGNSVIRKSGGTWQRVGGMFNSSGVEEVVEFGGDLVVAGSFSSNAGTPMNRIARFTGGAWQPMDEGFASIPSQASWTQALAIYNNELYAGGQFNRASGVPANNIARWDGTFWNPVSSGTSGPISDLLVYGGRLIAAGEFSTVGLTPASNIASWNGSAWESLGSGITIQSGSRLQMTEYRGDLVVAGRITNAGGSAVNGLARWNGSNWVNWAADDALPGVLMAVHAAGDVLFVGGNVNASNALRVGRWSDVAGCPPVCDGIDFNNDNSLFDPQDIDAFLSVFSEGPCIPESATCNDVDFNNDGSTFDPCDIDSFLLVFGEGPCTSCGV